MPSFGSVSKQRLANAHPQLQRLFNEVVKHYDCKILESTRTREQQVKNVAKGVSKTMNSKHVPPESAPDDWKALAVDVVPYPFTHWPDRESPTYVKDIARMYRFGGQVEAIAKLLDIPIRWGGDWDGDQDLFDQKFDDLPHFELRL
jgi:peptidoglycan L-alanyl-D-glutamate endopeptidase CwlK